MGIDSALLVVLCIIRFDSSRRRVTSSSRVSYKFAFSIESQIVQIGSECSFLSNMNVFILYSRFFELHPLINLITSIFLLCNSILLFLYLFPFSRPLPNTIMVYVDVPGLPREFNIKYRPPRVSLFPPSWRDRAYLRSLHRDVLRQTVTEAEASGGNKSVVTIPSDLDKKTEPESKADKKVGQPTETHCCHGCFHHQHEGKKSDKNQESKAKDGKKNKKHNKKNDGNSNDASENDSKDSSDEDGTKQKGKKDKAPVTHDKGGKGKKTNDSDFKVPDTLKSFLPYPFTSPNAHNFWGHSNFQRPFPETPAIENHNSTGWNFDHKLEAARRADEKYMWNQLSEQEQSVQRGSFQWLAERDIRRQAKLTQAVHDLGALSLDPSVGRRPLGLMTALYGAQNQQNVHHGTNGMLGGLPINSASLQAFVDQYGNIRLWDGTMVVLSGQGTNDPRQQGLPNFQQHQPMAPISQFHPSGQSHQQQQQQHWNGAQMGPAQQQPLHQQNQGPQGNWQNPAQPSHGQNGGNISHQNPGAPGSHQGNQQFNDHSDQNKPAGHDEWIGSNNGHVENNPPSVNAGQPSGRRNPPRKDTHNASHNHDARKLAPKYDLWEDDTRKPDNDDNDSDWEEGNDENSKPHNHKNRGHARFKRQKNRSDEIENSDSQDSQQEHHRFFSRNSPVSDTAAAGPTMSGAKRRTGKKGAKSIVW